MRVAIIGSGIAGNTAAYKLRERFDVTVYEAADYVGGRTNTVDVNFGTVVSICEGAFAERAIGTVQLHAIGVDARPVAISTR